MLLNQFATQDPYPLHCLHRILTNRSACCFTTQKIPASGCFTMTFLLEACLKVKEPREDSHFTSSPLVRLSPPSTSLSLLPFHLESLEQTPCFLFPPNPAAAYQLRPQIIGGFLQPKKNTTSAKVPKNAGNRRCISMAVANVPWFQNLDIFIPEWQHQDSWQHFCLRFLREP